MRVNIRIQPVLFNLELMVSNDSILNQQLGLYTSFDLSFLEEISEQFYMRSYRLPGTTESET